MIGRTTTMHSCQILAMAGVAAIGAAMPAHAQAPVQDEAAACAGLTASRLPDLRIAQAAMVVPAPRWSTPEMHAGQGSPATVTRPFCRVAGMIEGEIGFEAWLPARADWQGRLLGAGNGGFAGFIRYDGLALGVARGFAAVSTDTGHREGERDWSIAAPRRLENYGHRAQHLLAVNAKRIVAAFYGRPPAHSYFLGCSGGGMQAMNEAQRYPADYDGIVAGAAGQSIVGISARWLESALVAQRTPADMPTTAEWRAIADHQIAGCDRLDGVRDGILSRPDLCTVGVAGTPGLTARKMRVATDLLGPVRGRDGAVLFPAFPAGVVYLPLTSPGRAGEAFAQFLYGDPAWDVTRFDAARDVPLLEATAPGLRFTNPDLDAFSRRGGKLITAHGLTDPVVPAQSTIDYHNAVARYLGAARTDAFFRTFVAPGVDHCGGGAGPDHFTFSYEAPAAANDPAHDLLAAVVAWVEQGRAPERVTASKITDGRITMSRPLCAYPQVARYVGRGDANTAAAFVCAKP